MTLRFSRIHLPSSWLMHATACALSFLFALCANTCSIAQNRPCSQARAGFAHSQ